MQQVEVWRGRHGDPVPLFGPLPGVRSGDVLASRPGSVTVRDLYIDVMVPTDGRHQRLLDLDEFADAMASGQLDAAVAIDQV